MADPIQTVLETENAVERIAKHNENNDKRRWGDVRTVTASTYTVDPTDEVIYVDPTSNAITLTLPAVADVDGMMLDVIALNVTNTITLDGNGSETINGSTTKTIGTAGHWVRLVATSAGWRAAYSAAL